MRRPRLTAAMALATATIVTVAGCSTQIGGTASPAITGGATTSSSSTGSTSNSSSTSSSSKSSSSSSESTSSAIPSSDSSATATTAQSTTSPSTSDDIPTDIPTDLPTDFPTFSQDYPAGWPAELQLPAGATIITSTESGGEMSVTFQGTGTGADLMAALDANAVAAGFTQTSADAASGAYTASYSKSGSTLEISLLEYGGTAFGSLVISPA
jgi:hypothetical protein